MNICIRAGLALEWRRGVVQSCVNGFALTKQETGDTTLGTAILAYPRAQTQPRLHDALVRQDAPQALPNNRRRSTTEQPNTTPSYIKTLENTDCIFGLPQT